ncbi:catalytic, putative [Ectocarpus siliculosus]|uniref:Catalytic, putative n=1 Tax=Ectocarpus siliculosus TaxID=2880 RepID=D8LRC2_ECTSI|nr:catalytic, putative [Ectocarpus siliculosus]|eukprot:CBN75027.1 catalytic, putative [Ectocarpus siliculosus]
MLGLSPAPSVVLCSPLTRAVQTAIAMFGGSGIPIVAVPEAREAYGRFPCDRHRDRSELELMFGDSVDFSLCAVQDTAWSPHHREEMSQLDRRVAGFVDGLLRREAGHVFVVSHGVFIEATLRQLAHGYPGHIGKNRVHNCDVHSFVFSVAPSSSAAAAAAAAVKPSSTSAAAAAAAGASSCSGGGVGRVPPAAATSTAPPRVEAYLTGQGLALACAARMPLPAVAHVNRTIRRFSGDGLSLTERQFSALLARCEIGAQETRWLYCALDREGGGKVAAGDLLQALVAFHSGGEEAGSVAEPPGAHARHGLMDLRVRYQREMYGTPLANYELLDATFKRILFTVLAMS